MQSGTTRFAVFVFQPSGDGRRDDAWERKTAPQSSPKPLFALLQESDELRALPPTDVDVLEGPPQIIGERRLPAELLRQLLCIGKVRVVTSRR